MTIDDLRADVMGEKPTAPTVDPAYVEKQLHPVPDGTVIKDRKLFLAAMCKGKNIIHVGASGALHKALIATAAGVYGWDLKPESSDITQVNLDEIGLELPRHHGVQLIVCGEVIEHLSNPGHFLDRLRKTYPGVRVVITVPNAFSDAGRAWLGKHIENVNRDHVAWYSYWTLRELLRRAGYEVRWSGWYNGNPLTAEGLIAVVE